MNTGTENQVSEVNDVPCRDCRICCKVGAVLIDEARGDVPGDYQLSDAGRALARKPNGDCIYLEEGEHGGCSIHDRAPAVCRMFDCRVLAKNLGYTLAKLYVRQGLVPAAVIRQGNRLRRE